MSQLSTMVSYPRQADESTSVPYQEHVLLRVWVPVPHSTLQSVAFDHEDQAAMMRKKAKNIGLGLRLI